MDSLTVIKTGGKQYLVKLGDILRIEKIEGKAGKKVSFKDVLLFFDSKKKKVEIGKPNLKIKVEAEILAQEKGPKIKIIKYKPKTRYRRKRGHRQLYTKVKIIKVGVEGKTRVM
ncbi:50S ribosomal protein L21 [Patescibacteria group bacterium]|nr:50S ribosomal protein L21 [Patescibacteria group bacterium]